MKKIIAAAMLVASFALVSASAKTKVTEEVKVKIIDHQNSASGGSLPDWVKATREGSKRKIAKALDVDYKDNHLFIIIDEGPNLAFLKTWARQVNGASQISQEFERVVAEVVQAESEGKSDTEKASANEAAKIYSATMTNVTLNGLSKEDYYWIKTRTPKVDVKNPKLCAVYMDGAVNSDNRGICIIKTNYASMERRLRKDFEKIYSDFAESRKTTELLVGDELKELRFIGETNIKSLVKLAMINDNKQYDLPDRHRFFALLRMTLQPVFFHFGIQRRPAHTQHLRCSGDIAVRPVHRLANHPLLLGLADSPERACARCHPEGGARRIYLDVLCCQILRFAQNDRRVAQNDRLFNHVLQFADIPAPTALRQHRSCIRSNPRQRPMILLGKPFQEHLRQRHNIFLSLPECRQGDMNGIDPIIQILPEPSLTDQLLQIHICGADQTDIDGLRLIAAHPYDAPALNST